MFIVLCRYSVRLKFNLQYLMTRKLKTEKPTADESEEKQGKKSFSSHCNYNFMMAPTTVDFCRSQCFHVFA